MRNLRKFHPAYPLNPVNEEFVTAEQYLKLSEDEKSNIDSVTIVPPEFGKKGFGGFLIRFKLPVYKSVYRLRSSY